MEETSSFAMRAFMLGVAIFFVACFKSCSELRYAIGKTEGTGKVYEIAESTGRRGAHTGWRVRYNFRHAETNERERGYTLVSDDEVGQFWEGQEVPIEYYGSSLVSSRIKGYDNRFWVWVFLGSMAFTIGTVVIMSWQSMREEKKSSRKRSR